MCRHTLTTRSTTIRLAIARFRTARNILASRALLADFGHGSFRVSSADGPKHGTNGKRTAKDRVVDKGSWHNDDTARRLQRNLNVQLGIGSIRVDTTTVDHAPFNILAVDLGMLVGIFNAIVVIKVIIAAAAVDKLRDIVPELFADSIRSSVFTPDTETTKTFLDDISSRNTSIQVVVGVRRTVPSVVGTESVAPVVSVVTLTMGANSIVNVHVRSKVGAVAQCLGNRLEIFEEFLVDGVVRDGPEIVLDTVVRVGESPRHFNLNGSVLLDFFLDLVRIMLEHEKGRNGNITTRTIVRHDGFGRLARRRASVLHALVVAAEADIVSDNDTSGTRALGVADLIQTDTDIDRKRGELVHIQDRIELNRVELS